MTIIIIIYIVSIHRVDLSWMYEKTIKYSGTLGYPVYIAMKIARIH